MVFLKYQTFALPLLLFSMSTNSLSIRSSKVPLPPLTGKFGVGTINLKLTDTSRSDPFAPNPSTPRSIMAQVYYPSKNTKNTPFAEYMSPTISSFYETAYQLPNGTLSSLQPNSHSSAPISCEPNPNIVLFSTTLGSSRSLHTVLCEDLASHGFIVIILEHPYETDIVEFPDGTLIHTTVPDEPTDAEVTKLSDTRVKDNIFVLNSLKNITGSIPNMARGKSNHGKVGIIGHSLGGSTAADLMLADKRVVAGINMDGKMWGSVVEKGLDNPFLIMGAGAHTRSNYTTWGTFWGNQRGWKRELHLGDSQHRSYSDVSAFVELLGLREVFPKEVMDEMVGTLNGIRSVEVQKAYVNAFFKFALRGVKTSLFDGPDSRYKEMVIVD